MSSTDDHPDGPDETPAATEPVACSACRGTGQVISNLGGTPHLVECPWCDGGGVRLADHDAQARRRAAAAEKPSEDPSPDPLPPEPPGDQAA